MGLIEVIVAVVLEVVFAHINEGSAVLHVNLRHPLAADTNPGSAERPLETITEAVRRADDNDSQGLPTTIVVEQGVYRENVQLGHNEEALGAGITLEGRGDVVVSGSDVWSGWEPTSQHGVYRHEWPFDWGLAPVPPDWTNTYAADDLERNLVVRRREMIFVNDIPLTQVMSLDEIRAEPASFFVSEGEDTVYARLGADIDPGQATIEVSVRPNLLGIAERRNVTIKNITFEHASSPLVSSAVVVGDSQDVEILDSSFLWNNWGGLNIYRAEDVIVRNSVANHNGASGMTAFQTRSLLLEDTETSYNNWRGSRGWLAPDSPSAVDESLIDFATGQKFFRLRDAVFRRHRSVGNLSGGLWFDYDNEGVLLDEVVLRDNLTHGAFFEASQGPLTVRDSIVCGNETGILIANSQSGRILDSAIGGNSLGQIYVAGSAEGGRPVDNWETGQDMDLLAQDWGLSGNDIWTQHDQPGLATSLPAEVWQNFATTLASDLNEWHARSDEGIVATPDRGALSLAEWQRAGAHDRNSALAPPTESCSGQDPLAEIRFAP